MLQYTPGGVNDFLGIQPEGGQDWVCTCPVHDKSVTARGG
jgi:hypothetical protein